MPPAVAICLVAFNNENVIGEALDAALAQEGIAFRVHVWDNAGRDGTVDVIERREGVTLHSSDVNLGFCAANNRLIERTDEPFILFLNPDTRLLPGCLATLAAALDAAPRDVAAVAPKLLQPARGEEPALIDSAGIVLAKETLSPYDRGQGEPDRGQFDAPAEIFGPTFACALWRREAVEALRVDGQFLDESFFAYYEDVDIAWRARRLGRRFLYVPGAVCLHRRGHPHAWGHTLAARAFVNRYLLLIANETGRDGYGYLWRLLPREAARLLWKSFKFKGFGIAWRMLAQDWRGAWAKRRRLRAMEAGR
ncbi:MAG TPA: glycosyltransferase [bacterium]|nr:glycosyltransferase [bacterium]